QPQKPGAVTATSYADPAPSKPVVLPSEPVEANTTGPLPLPGTALGAIRAGGPRPAPQAALPGQIPRASGNPLENLTSDPLPSAKPARKVAAEATAQPVPHPVPRPVKKKKPKAPQT